MLDTGSRPRSPITDFSPEGITVTMNQSTLQSVIAQLNAGKQKQDIRPTEAERIKKKAAAAATSKVVPNSGAAGGPSGSSKSGGAVGAPRASRPQLSRSVHQAQQAAVNQAQHQQAALQQPEAPALDPATAPLLKRVKDVHDCLLDNNGSRLDVAALRRLTGLDLGTDTALAREVARHTRIEVGPDGVWYAYRPEIPGLYDRASLLSYLRDHKGPAVQLSALRRAYKAAATDIQALVSQGTLLILGHADADRETVQVRDMMGMEGVADDVRGLWFEVATERVPSERRLPRGLQELQEAVVRAGLRSAVLHSASKRPVLPTPGERKRSRRQAGPRAINIDKATNAHLPQLFAAAQPKSLDAAPV